MFDPINCGYDLTYVLIAAGFLISGAMLIINARFFKPKQEVIVK